MSALLLLSAGCTEENVEAMDDNAIPGNQAPAPDPAEDGRIDTTAAGHSAP